MTWNSATLFAIAVLSSAPTSAAVRAQNSQARELAQIITQRVQVAETLGVPELWSEARSLATLIGDEAGSAFDQAVDRQLESDDQSPRALLFLAASRLFGEDIDYELIVSKLQPLLSGADEELAVATAELLGSSDLRADLSSDERSDLADEMIRVARDGDSAPERRVACAIAAYEIGLGPQISAGQRVLFGFLDSNDPSLRAKGALGLAAIDAGTENRDVESELSRLAQLPGSDGRLAAAYLKQLDIVRLKETQLRRMREQSEDLTGSAMSEDPGMRRFALALDLVLRDHLEGDKVDREELVEAAVNGMLRSLDQHSAYFPPRAYKRFEQDLEAEYGGIGAYVREDPDDHLFTITRPIYSGPAYKAGLATDDKIVRIGDWPTVGKPVDEIIKRLKGRPDTPVTLYVWRRGMEAVLIDRPTEEMAVTLQRDQIVIPPVHSDFLPGDIGLVELTTFSRVASQELIKRLDKMRKAGMRGVILDLRSNSGGLLSEAVNVCDLFLPKDKAVVSTESRFGRERSYKTPRPAFLHEDMPVVVLINRFSASASEIVSGALQDHGRATLVGRRSFGKGSVQNLVTLPGESDDRFADENQNRRYDNWETITKDWNGNDEFDYAPRVKLTVERYLLPTGRSIHRELDEEGNIVSPGGVEPDVLVPQKRWDQWKLKEMQRLFNDRSAQNWAREQYAANRDLFDRIATGDMDDPSLYPGFEEFYASLDSALSRHDVRFLMRREVRRLIQDLRGEAFPLGGDYQEDLQLQAAIRVVLEELGESPDDIDAYAVTFDPVFDKNDDAASVVVRSPGADARAGLEAARALIAEAGTQDGHLSEASLRELNAIIDEALNKKN